MPVEFIGIAHTSDYSETNALSGPVIQPDYLYRIARVHEQSGFDRVLIAHSSSMPDGFTVASQILNATERLGVLLAHRPGFIAPRSPPASTPRSTRSTRAGSRCT